MTAMMKDLIHQNHHYSDIYKKLQKKYIVILLYIYLPSSGIRVAFYLIALASLLLLKSIHLCKFQYVKIRIYPAHIDI